MSADKVLQFQGFLPSLSRFHLYSAMLLVCIQAVCDLQAMSASQLCPNGQSPIIPNSHRLYFKALPAKTNAATCQVHIFTYSYQRAWPVLHSGWRHSCAGM